MLTWPAKGLSSEAAVRVFETWLQWSSPWSRAVRWRVNGREVLQGSCPRSGQDFSVGIDAVFGSGAWCKSSSWTYRGEGAMNGWLAVVV